jgi:rhodanese-related sulfurtransferase
MVSEARDQIENLTPEQVEAEIADASAVVVDIREPDERASGGVLAGSIRAPRGMLEFYADPSSPYHRPELDPQRRTILYCASGGRSALAAATLKRMGYRRIAHLAGGLKAWTAAGRALALLALFGLLSFNLPTPAIASSANQTADTLVPFEASGLPAGEVRGIPRRMSLPAGWSLKHAHGGPTYVYVISGSIDITDTDGNTTSYQPGDFFWEQVGFIHTAHTSDPTELFVLHFLAPGAAITIPTP